MPRFGGNSVRNHVQTVAGNMQVQFEVSNFECIGLSHGSAICAQTDRDKCAKLKPLNRVLAHLSKSNSRTFKDHTKDI